MPKYQNAEFTWVFLQLCRVLACLSFASSSSHAGEPVVELERMTWVDVRTRLNSGATTVIIPTGGTEQNGPHMVLGKHNYIVRETTKRIAHTLGNTLVAPVLAYVPQGNPRSKSGHMAYPGTISLPDETFAKVLEAVATSLKTHGFKRILLIGDSGGNQASQKAVAAKLSAAWTESGVQVLHVDAYYSDRAFMGYLTGRGETEETVGFHAGIRDTSELMAILPGGVMIDRAVADAEGVTGDPRRASVEIGQKLLDLKVAAAVRQIKAADSEVATPDVPAGFFQWLKQLIFG